MTSSDLIEPQRDVWKLAALSILAAGLILQLRFLIISWQNGGHVWLQGDWLISLAAGQIRRGAFGELILNISGFLGYSPLDVVIGIQFVLAVFVFIGFGRLLYLQPSRSMVLVVFTPGCFAILWGLDPISAFRKELIGLTALIWLAQPNGGLSRIILTGGLMLLGGISHEIVILLVPAWVISVWLFQPQSLLLPSARAFVGLVVLLAGAQAIYALVYHSLPDHMPLCDALTERGLSGQKLCGGAIQWLADPQNGVLKVREALHRSWTAWLLPIAWAIATVPIWRVWARMTPLRTGLGYLILVSIAPILLLYPVGLDWGRWFAVQTAVISIQMLGLGIRGEFTESRPISSLERGFWFGLCLLWGFRHDPIVTFRGFLLQFFD